jgi:hypothetical protein
MTSMRVFALPVALLALLPLPPATTAAMAQVAASSPAGETASPEVPAAAPASATAATPPATSPPARAQRQRRARDIDARHCLDLGDSRAIARCAEQYRRSPRRAASKGPGAAAASAPATAPAPAASAPAPSSAALPSPRAERRRRGREVDARHCLDLGDDRAIARCAERYR